MDGGLRARYRLFLMERHLFSAPPPKADKRIPYGPEPLQFGDLRLPPSVGPHPVAVVIHGGFWRARYDLEHIGHTCAALTASGVATWSIEYRRVGNPGGGWPGTFEDVGAATDHLRGLATEYNLDLARVVALGHSAGGHLATWVAGRHRIPKGKPLYTPSPLYIRAAIPLAGVLDLRLSWEMRLSDGVVAEFMGGTPEQVPERYASGSPIELLPLRVRQTLIHGTRDENVPYEISKKYAATALVKGDNVSLVTLRGAGHFELIDPKMREWQHVRRAVLQAVMGTHRSLPTTK